MIKGPSSGAGTSGGGISTPHRVGTVAALTVAMSVSKCVSMTCFLTGAPIGCLISHGFKYTVKGIVLTVQYLLSWVTDDYAVIF